jgi:hypothetical protein
MLGARSQAYSKKLRGPADALRCVIADKRKGDTGARGAKILGELGSISRLKR